MVQEALHPHHIVFENSVSGHLERLMVRIASKIGSSLEFISRLSNSFVDDLALVSRIGTPPN